MTTKNDVIHKSSQRLDEVLDVIQKEGLFWAKNGYDLSSIVSIIGLQAAYDVCPDGSWMLWLLQELGMSEVQNLEFQLLMLSAPLSDGESTINDLITDERPLHFIDLKRRRIAGEIISEEDWDAAAFDARCAATDWDARDDWAGWAHRPTWLSESRSASNTISRVRQWQAEKVRAIVPDLQAYLDKVGHQTLRWQAGTATDWRTKSHDELLGFLQSSRHLINSLNQENEQLKAKNAELAEEVQEMIWESWGEDL